MAVSMAVSSTNQMKKTLRNGTKMAKLVSVEFTGYFLLQWPSGGQDA